MIKNRLFLFYHTKAQCQESPYIFHVLDYVLRPFLYTFNKNLQTKRRRKISAFYSLIPKKLQLYQVISAESQANKQHFSPLFSLYHHSLTEHCSNYFAIYQQIQACPLQAQVLSLQNSAIVLISSLIFKIPGTQDRLICLILQSLALFKVKINYMEIIAVIF